MWVQIDLRFTPFQMAALLAGHFWWLSLGITLVYLFIALTRPAGRRCLWFRLAAILPAFYFLLAVCAGVQDGYHNVQQYRLARAQRPIRKPRQVNGGWFPVGTRVYWKTTAEDDFEGIELPGPSQVFSLPLTGSLYYSVDVDTPTQQQFWNATLATPATISGWPCAPGPVALDNAGTLHRCILAAPRTFGNHTVPARSALEIHAGITTATLSAPMPLPELGATLAARSSSQFDRNGCLVSAKPPEDHPLLVRGVALKYKLHWHYVASPPGTCASADFIRGSLARDIPHSEELTEGLEVKVSPQTGQIAAYTASVLEEDPFAADEGP